MGTAGGQQHDSERLNWPVLLLFWAAISVILIARAMLATNVPLLLDTDDAMRLTVVRDWLGGQGWYDNVQHRLNTPYGAEIHWSRLVDVPIGALIQLLRPLFGDFSETLVAYIWPLALLLVLLWLSARVTLKLVGREGLLPALALPMLSPAVVAEFSPGRLDHHSLQILLTLALLWCSLEALRRPRWAIAGGIVAATALAIGTEAIPMVGAAIAAFALTWVFRPERADALRGFGLGFGGAALVHLVIAMPPARWLTPACDAFSVTYAAVGVGVGVAFLGLSLLPLSRRPPAVRLAVGALAGAALVGGLILLFPECLRGPYAGMDPWLVENWLARIIEAKPVWDSVAALPDLTIGVALPPILGLAVILYRLWRGLDNRDLWLILGLYLAVAVAVMLVQVRGARLAAPLAIPAAAWLIAAARARYLASRRPLAIAGLVGAWIAFAGAAVLVLVNVVLLGTEQLTSPTPAATVAQASDDKLPCLMPEAFVDLAGLPPERIMAPIDLGSHLLLFTPHAVVAAPYHRNQQGVLDTFAFFNGPIAAAREILVARGVTLVVICPQMAEMNGMREIASDAFVQLYADKALPGWLQDVSLPGAALQVFAVAAD